MKNGKRMVAILLLAGVLCLSLGGCKALDDARAAQGFWTENGVSFTIGGKSYKRLPQSEALDLLYVADYGTAQTIYVTDSDVPVLLAETYGKEFTAAADGMLYMEWGSPTYGPQTSMRVVYCRADQYAEVATQLEKGFQPVGFCCVYEEYDEKRYEYHERLYRLTPQETAVIAELMEAERSYANKMMYISYDYGVEINRCNDNMMLQEEAALLCEREGDYFLYGEDDNGEWLITVPNEYHAVAAALMEPEISQYQEWQEDATEGFVAF